jgi:hypothetical protein
MTLNYLILTWDYLASGVYFNALPRLRPLLDSPLRCGAGDR